MGNQFLKIDQPAKAYTQADISSGVVTTLNELQYEIIEVKMNHPTSDFDFVQVKDIDNRHVWVCTRSFDEVFGEILTTEDFTQDTHVNSSDAAAIDESHLTELLPLFSAFTYHLHDANYPFKLEGISVPQAPPASNNCCTFVEALVVKAWQNALTDFTWSSAKHGQMMIFSTEDYFSPVTCLIESEMATSSDADDVPEKWSVIQGWRKEWSGGHTFIVLDYHPETDRVLTLESNKAFGLNGVGYRNLGNYRDIDKPPSDWWSYDELPTWKKIKSTYKFRKKCALKVKNLSWI